MDIKWIATLAFVLAIGFVAGVWTGGDEAGESGTSEASVYRCPMHPTVVSERPGSCPVCGMDLVKDRQDGGNSGVAGAPKERKVLYWRAPMDPNYTSQKPG